MTEVSETNDLKQPAFEPWCRTRYAARTRRVYGHCQDWFDATIGLDEFYLLEQEIYEVPSHIRVVCRCRDDLFGLTESRNLTQEFEFVAALATTIIWASEEMLDDGHANDTTALVRAIYFAREWSDFADSFDALPPTPVYSQ